MANEIYLTLDGRKKIIDELERLKKRRPSIQEEIARAREHGDLKENAEYHAAKETLTKLSMRIVDIETKLLRARIVDKGEIGTDSVRICTTVMLRDEDSGDEFEYTLVDVEEANIAENKISVQSPMAQGLLGHKLGESVKVPLPNGYINLKILGIK